MARERVSNRVSRDAYILPELAEGVLFSAAESFQREAPLEVDLGCGRGRFLVARAAAHPERNFLGVDRLMLRLRKLDRRAFDAGLTNIRLIRGDTETVLRDQLSPQSIAVCYVFFPDPWPKRRHHGRRLVSPAFVDHMDRLLAPDGLIHMATDHADYYKAMQAVWDRDPRFERTEVFVPCDAEETDFGMIFRAQGLAVGRCSYRRRARPTG